MDDSQIWVCSGEILKSFQRVEQTQQHNYGFSILYYVGPYERSRNPYYGWLEELSRSIWLYFDGRNYYSELWSMINDHGRAHEQTT